MNLRRANINLMDRAFLGKLAWLYYIDGLTQKEIAKQVGLSRLKVVRLLQQARADGIVEIHIAPDLRINTGLARTLEDEFELQEVIVTEPDEDGQAIARAGARYLDRNLTDGIILGIGMGRTIASLLPNVSPRKIENLSIRTLAGAYEEPGRETNAYDISWRLSDLFGAQVEPLHSPLIVAHPETRDALLKDRLLRSVLESLSGCDLALIGLGALVEDSPLVRLEYCTSEQLDKLAQRGAVGEILGRFYDLQGNPISTEFDRRTIGITMAELCQISTVVALAYGEMKVAPIIGALQSGCIDVLITDRSSAEEVLARTSGIHPSAEDKA